MFANCYSQTPSRICRKCVWTVLFKTTRVSTWVRIARKSLICPLHRKFCFFGLHPLVLGLLLALSWWARGTIRGILWDEPRLTARQAPYPLFYHSSPWILVYNYLCVIGAMFRKIGYLSPELAHLELTMNKYMRRKQKK